MARYIGQIQGEFNPWYDLVFGEMGGEVDRIVKIGIQLEKDYMIEINGEEFEIGKTDILEFEDTDIKKIQLFHKADRTLKTKIPVIIDYVYEKDE